MKFTCIIDACSYINLTEVEFNQSTLLKILEKNVDLVFSSQVNAEINRHSTERMPSVSKRRKQIIKTKKYSLLDYEKRVFNTTRRSDSKNQGEKDNFTVTIDQYLSFKKVGLIYLTDDNNALRGSLLDVVPAFPLFQIWSSYDVILYLYLTNNINSLELAQSVIKDLDNQIAPYKPGMKPETTQEKIKRLKEYNNRITLLNRVLN